MISVIRLVFGTLFTLVWAVLLFVVKIVLPATIGAALGLSLVVGIAAIGDTFYKPNLPCVRPLSRSERAVAMERASVRVCSSEYDRLQGALVWLDAVSPPVADWVRDRWEAGKLWFVNSDRYLAAWYPAWQVLAFDIKTLDRSDEFKASVLAHEFRHSRQGCLGLIRRDLAALFGVDRTDLVEDEACEFQGRVARAIRGQE